jgi:hypothetical protein
MAELPPVDQMTTDDLRAEVISSREWIAIMEPTICWNVSCAHEADYLDESIARYHGASDAELISDLRRKIATLQGQLKEVRCAKLEASDG